MYRETKSKGEPQKPEDNLFWNPLEEPHRSARKLAKPRPCSGTCVDSLFSIADGCDYCDYNPNS